MKQVQHPLQGVLDPQRLVTWCLGSQGVAKGGLDRYSAAPRVGGELSHLGKTLPPDPAASSVALHIAHTGSAASTRAGAVATAASPEPNLGTLNQPTRCCWLPRPRSYGALTAEAGGGLALERISDTLAVPQVPAWPAAAPGCLCRVSPDGSSSGGSFTSGLGACTALERARSGGSLTFGSESGPRVPLGCARSGGSLTPGSCVRAPRRGARSDGSIACASCARAPLEHARSAPSALQSGRWAAALRRAHLDRAPAGSGTPDRASASWRALPHDEHGRRDWGRKRPGSATGERGNVPSSLSHFSSPAQRSRSDGAWLATMPPGAPQRARTAVVGGTAATTGCNVSPQAAGPAGVEPHSGLCRVGLGGQGFAKARRSPSGSPAPLDGHRGQRWNARMVGWQSSQKRRTTSPLSSAGSPTPDQSAADLSRRPADPGPIPNSPSADQWPPLPRTGWPEPELWPAPCGGSEVGLGLEAGFAGAAREAPALVDAAVRLYGLGVAEAFRSASAAAAAVAAAQAELAQAEQANQVRIRVEGCFLERGTALTKWDMRGITAIPRGLQLAVRCARVRASMCRRRRALARCLRRSAPRA